MKTTLFLWQYTRVDHQLCGHMNAGLNEFAVFISGTGYKTLKNLHLFLKHGTFVIKNKHLFHTNNRIHSIHTRFKTNLHPPTANPTKFQKAFYHTSINIFNSLPDNIRGLDNETDSTVLEWFKGVVTHKFLLKV